MPLIPCPDCQHDCSTSAISCTKCGYVFEVVNPNILGPLITDSKKSFVDLFRNNLFLKRCDIIDKIILRLFLLFYTSVVIFAVLIETIPDSISFLQENPNNKEYRYFHLFILSSPAILLSIFFYILTKIITLIKDFNQLKSETDEQKSVELKFPFYRLRMILIMFLIFSLPIGEDFGVVLFSLFLGYLLYNHLSHRFKKQPDL